MTVPLAAGVAAAVLSTLLGQHWAVTCLAALVASWVAVPEGRW